MKKKFIDLVKGDIIYINNLEGRVSSTEEFQRDGEIKKHVIRIGSEITLNFQNGNSLGIDILLTKDECIYRNKTISTYKFTEEEYSRRIKVRSINEEIKKSNKRINEIDIHLLENSKKLKNLRTQISNIEKLVSSLILEKDSLIKSINNLNNRINKLLETSG